jgi:hypothetical protein
VALPGHLLEQIQVVTEIVEVMHGPERIAYSGAGM